MNDYTSHDLFDIVFKSSIILYGKSYYCIPSHTERDDSIDVIVPKHNDILIYHHDFGEYVDIVSQEGIAGGYLWLEETETFDEYLTFIDTDGKIIGPDHKWISYEKLYSNGREIDLKDEDGSWWTVNEKGALSRSPEQQIN